MCNKIQGKNWQREKTGQRQRKKHTELIKSVKKKRNAHKRKKQTKFVNTILQSDGRPKQTQKDETKKKIRGLKNEENKVQTEMKLYSSKLKDQHHSQENTSPDTPKVPQITTSEVKKILKEITVARQPAQRT